MKLWLIKFMAYPLVYFSICFILASGFGAAFSKTGDLAPDGYYTYRNYFDRFILGVGMGITIGLFVYGIIFSISAFIYSFIPQKISLVTKLIFFFFTIIFGCLCGSVFAAMLAI